MPKRKRGEKEEEEEPRLVKRAKRPELISYLRSHLEDGSGVTFGVFGASKSGKSTLLVEILNKVFDKDYKTNKPEKKPIVIFFTGSKNAKPLKKLSKDVVRFNEGSFPKMRTAVIRHQKNWDNNNRFMIVYDDVLDIHDDKTVNSLILTDRNSDVSSIVASQYHRMVHPKMRTSVNFLLLLRTFQEGLFQVIECYMQHWLPDEWSKAEKRNFFQAFTKDGKGAGFLVNNLDNEVYFFDEKKRLFPLEKLVDNWREDHNL